MLTKGCRRVEVGRQLVAKPCFTKLFSFLGIQNVLVQPGELLLQVEDPVVIEIKVKQPSGGCSQEAVGGKINHQAERLVARKAEVEMIFMAVFLALKKVAGISRKG